MKILNTIAGLACLCFLPGSVAADQSVNAELWARIAIGGHVLLLKHASALHETSASTDLRNSNCSTHDELSEQGQRQAERLRAELEQRRIPIARVLTSHDCRCVQTAGLAFGRAEPWSIIDDLSEQEATNSEEKSAALREAIGRWSSDGNLVLISHPAVFQVALGISPVTGELLVIEPVGDGDFRVFAPLRYE